MMIMRINVKVFPKSGRQEVLQVSEGEYRVYLKKVAEDGRANMELEKLLKKYFGVNVKIVKGFTSRNKVAEVENGN